MSGNRGTPYGVRAQLYTGQAGALRPAGGFLRKADDFQQICNQLPFLTGDATLPLRWLRQLPFCGLAAQKQRALQVDKKTVIKRTL